MFMKLVAVILHNYEPFLNKMFPTDMHGQAFSPEYLIWVKSNSAEFNHRFSSEKTAVSGHTAPLTAVRELKREGI